MRKSSNRITPIIFLGLTLLIPQAGNCFYNPSTGKWLSRDPIAELGGPNSYASVGNDSVSHCDPYGLADHTYNIYDIMPSAGDGGKKFSFDTVVGQMKVYTKVDISHCSCLKGGGCSGDVKLTVGFRYTGFREDPDNIFGAGPGNSNLPEVTPMAYVEFGDGSFVPGPTPINWSGTVSPGGSRSGKNAQNFVEYSTTVPCAGGSMKGDMLLSNGVKDAGDSWHGSVLKVRGPIMFKILFNVQIEPCGVTAEDSVSLEAGQNHPASNPGSPYRKPEMTE